MRGRKLGRHTERQNTLSAANAIEWARKFLEQAETPEERIKIRQSTRVTLRSYGYTAQECRAEGF